MTNEERAEETRLKLESIHREILMDLADEIRRECAESITDAIAERLIENFLLRSDSIEVYDEESEEYFYEPSVYDKPRLKGELLKTIRSAIMGKSRSCTTSITA